MQPNRVSVAIISEREKALFIRAADGRCGWVQRKSYKDGTITADALAKAFATRVAEYRESMATPMVDLSGCPVKRETDKGICYIVKTELGRDLKQADFEMWLPKSIMDGHRAPLSAVNERLGEIDQKAMRYHGHIAEFCPVRIAVDQAAQEPGPSVDAKAVEDAAKLGPEVEIEAAARRAKALVVKAVFERGAELTEADAVLNFDGGCRGNPGPMTIGVAGTACGQPVRISKAIGHGTNNIAEWTAALEALRHAASLGARRVILRGDSQLVVSQMTGEWRCWDKALRGLMAEAHEVVAGLDAVLVEWVPRHENAMADALTA